MANRLEIHFLNVRGGDCTIIAAFNESGLMCNVIVDAGERNGDIIKYASTFGLIEKRKTKDGKEYLFDFGILTHYHADHSNFPENIGVLQSISPYSDQKKFSNIAGIVNLNAYSRAPVNLFSMQKYKPQTGTDENPIPKKDGFDYCGKVSDILDFALGFAKVSFVCGNGYVVDKGLVWSSADSRIFDLINPTSLGFVLEWREFKFFSAGDMGIIEKGLPDIVDRSFLFKASHHGSRQNGVYNDTDFIQTRLQPVVTVIPAWEKHRLPEVEFLRDLAQNQKSKIFIGNNINRAFLPNSYDNVRGSLRNCADNSSGIVNNDAPLSVVSVVGDNLNDVSLRVKSFEEINDLGIKNKHGMTGHFILKSLGGYQSFDQDLSKDLENFKNRINRDDSLYCCTFSNILPADSKLKQINDDIKIDKEIFNPIHGLPQEMDGEIWSILFNIGAKFNDMPIYSLYKSIGNNIYSIKQMIELGDIHRFAPVKDDLFKAVCEAVLVAVEQLYIRETAEMHKALGEDPSGSDGDDDEVVVGKGDLGFRPKGNRRSPRFQRVKDADVMKNLMEDTDFAKKTLVKYKVRMPDGFRNLIRNVKKGNKVPRVINKLKNQRKITAMRKTKLREPDASVV